MELATVFLETAVRIALPLAFAALGEMLVQRTGIINIGLEGIIIAGAFAALVGTHSAGAGGGLLYAASAGVAMALVFGIFVVSLRTDQIITGTAVTLLGLGLTGLLYRTIYGVQGAALGVPPMRPLAIPLLSELPVIGRALFTQPVLAYGLYALIPMILWWSRRTHAGLALRAVGENPSAASAAGISIARTRMWALVAAGIFGGISGGALVLAQAGTFAEGMSAGRGFIAIAIVALGRWHPVGVALGAVVFGAASALQYLFQALGSDVPYQLFLALPYLLTLLALAGLGGRSAAPEALGRIDESR